MTQTALVLVLLGVLVAVLGWADGPVAPGTGLPALASAASTPPLAVSSPRAASTPARFGVWLGRQRILVRTIIAVLAVLWLFALRPLSVGDIVLVLVVAFGVAWILELLQRRPDDHPAQRGRLDEAEVLPELAGRRARRRADRPTLSTSPSRGGRSPHSSSTHRDSGISRPIREAATDRPPSAPPKGSPLNADRRRDRAPRASPRRCSAERRPSRRSRGSSGRSRG